MKKNLKKFIVLFLGLFTLVSCNKYVFIPEFEYKNSDELKNSLANATFTDDNGETGIYLFDDKDINESLNPSKTNITLKTYADKKGKNTMTKEKLIIKQDAFRVIATFIFTDEQGEMTESFVYTTLTALNKDIISTSGREFVTKKRNKRLYNQYITDLLIGYYITSEGGKSTFNEIAALSTNSSLEDCEEFAKRLIPNLKYVKVGK